MYKHFVVASAVALSVAGLSSAPTNSFANRETAVRQDDGTRNISSWQTSADTLTAPMAPGSPDLQPVANPTTPDVAHESASPERTLQTGLATWYGPGFVGNITFCGDVYDEWAYTAASNTLPCGLVVVVTNQDSGASVRVRITDRGGFGGAVIMDLSRAAFGAIASTADGVVPVTISQPAQ